MGWGPGHEKRCASRVLSKRPARPGARGRPIGRERRVRRMFADGMAGISPNVFTATHECVQFWAGCVQFSPKCVQFSAGCVHWGAKCVHFPAECVHPGLTKRSGRSVRPAAGECGLSRTRAWRGRRSHGNAPRLRGDGQRAIKVGAAREIPSSARDDREVSWNGRGIPARRSNSAAPSCAQPGALGHVSG
jgi:hypothetical protein